MKMSEILRSPESGMSGGSGAPIGGSSKISHFGGPSIGAPATSALPSEALADEPPKSKIISVGQTMGAAKRHEDNWSRTPNTTGNGAIHVKSFHCKLATESVEYLDKQINEWLDAHPQYEVKLVTTAVGEWTGKIKEPNLIVQVWV